MVLGGRTRSPIARLVDAVGWVPLLGALSILGGASALQSYEVITLPEWAGLPMGAYHMARGYLLNIAQLQDVPEHYADLAIAGIGLITLVAHRIVNFTLSIGGFGALAGAAWFFLRNMN